MERLLKMRQLELDYKALREHLDPDFIPEVALTVDIFRDLIDKAGPEYEHLFLGDFSDAIKEDVFFEEKQDIMVIHHYRYMPPVYHEHDFFELACVLSGTFENFIDDKKITLQTGDILILAPHNQHAVYAFDDDAVLINILIRSSTFEEHFMNVLPHNELLYDFFFKTLYAPTSTPYLLFKTGNDAVLKDQIIHMCREYSRNNRYKDTAMRALVSIFLVTLLRHHEANVIIPGIAPSVMNENTIYILEYMQNHYTTIKLSQLAELFNYSERQIQRIITAATGASFVENIKRLRMNRAAELLKSSTMTIAEIAESVGYSDTGNFRHIFKNYFGMTPQQYRK